MLSSFGLPPMAYCGRYISLNRRLQLLHWPFLQLQFSAKCLRNWAGVKPVEFWVEYFSFGCIREATARSSLISRFLKLAVVLAARMIGVLFERSDIYSCAFFDSG